VVVAITTTRPVKIPGVEQGVNVTARDCRWCVPVRISRHGFRHWHRPDGAINLLAAIESARRKRVVST
jgi:hypothetical protein